MLLCSTPVLKWWTVAASLAFCKYVYFRNFYYSVFFIPYYVLRILLHRFSFTTLLVLQVSLNRYSTFLDFIVLVLPCCWFLLHRSSFQVFTKYYRFFPIALPSFPMYVYGFFVNMIICRFFRYCKYVYFCLEENIPHALLDNSLNSLQLLSGVCEGVLTSFFGDV